MKVTTFISSERRRNIGQIPRGLPRTGRSVSKYRLLPCRLAARVTYIAGALVFLIFVTRPEQLKSLLFETAQAQAVVAHVQSASASGSASGTSLAAVFSSDNTAGNLIVAAVSFDSSEGTIWTCSDTRGNTYAQATFTHDTRHGKTLGICYAANVTSGANTVTVSFGGASQTWRRMAIAEYSGVAAVSPLDVDGVATNSTGTNTTSVTTNSFITTQAGDLIVAAVISDSGNTTITSGSGFTEREDTQEIAIEDQIQVKAGSIAGTFTFGADRDYIAHAIAFKAAAGGSPDITAPSISLTAPAPSTISLTNTVSATTSDNRGVLGVQFKLDGSNLQAEDTTAPYSISWDTTTASNGTHTLSARARDSAGNQATSSDIIVMVSNTVSPVAHYLLNDRVRTTGTLNVRFTPSISGNLLGTQPLGSYGALVSGPTSTDGLMMWWKTNFDTGVDGYSTETGITLLSDINFDGTTNSLDWSIMNATWFMNTIPTADLNKDGIVNSLDFSLLNRQWGR